MGIQYCQEKTENFIHKLQKSRKGAANPFEKARITARHLGAHSLESRTGDSPAARFGFWAPSWQDIPLEKIRLDLWIPEGPLDFSKPVQTARFRHEHIPLRRLDDTLWAIVSGLPAGTADQPGTFYQLTAENARRETLHRGDVLAASLPFGAFAPAELYSTGSMLAARRDKEHFQHRLNARPEENSPDRIPRIAPPANILQIHIGTATAEKSLQGLTRKFQALAQKLQEGADLTPAEESLTAYEAVQLMPIEPTIEYEEDTPFWNEFSGTGSTEIRLKKPDMTNWGYDVVISGSPAVNPALLETGRPAELLEFIETLHNFPTGPIRIILDIVYGHADNQALKLLEPDFLAGPNMYGQNLDYTNPMVRALLLEMQHRKGQYGIDGLRVDGAQDFQYWDAHQRRMVHDDDYLALMNSLTQKTAGTVYRPYMIFEDGRPWPRADWELSSSYREVTRQHPNVHQWGPLTFAHNTPFLYTYWVTRWWRLREIADQGAQWISGCANHDTLRRGTQIPLDSRINTRLGATLPGIIARAYNNPASQLLTYGFLPGIPMEFLQALADAPWSFIRNTDDRYGVKVVSEEALFLDWRVTEALFRRPEHFPKLKAMGFRTLPGLKRFLKALDHAVQLTGYDLDGIVKILRSLHPGFEGPEKTVRMLKLFARNWMEDLHDFCNISHYEPDISPELSRFNRQVRRFRLQHPWLRENLTQADTFSYVHPCEGSVLFFGRRTAPDRSEEVLLAVNMEGSPVTLIPAHLPLPDISASGWHPALVTPGTEILNSSREPGKTQDWADTDQPITLEDSRGILLSRKLS